MRPLRLKAALLALIAIATLVYPFVVYSSLKLFGPAPLSLVLLALLVARVVLRGDFRQPEQRVQFLLVGALCLLAALFQSEVLLKYYPAVMSLCFSVFFLGSLWGEQTLVERFARIFTQDFEPFQLRYMRRLSVVWSAALFANAAFAGYTACCTSLATWTLYNGAIAYALLIGFMLLELAYRQYYKARHQKQQEHVAARSVNS